MYRLKIEPFGSSGSIDDYPDHKCVTTLSSIRRLRFFGWNQILSIISKSAKKGGVIVGRGFLTFYFVKTSHISYFPPSPILIIFSFGKSKRKICSVSKASIFWHCSGESICSDLFQWHLKNKGEISNQSNNQQTRFILQLVVGVLTVKYNIFLCFLIFAKI